MSQIYTQVRKLAEQFIEPYADELDQQKEFPVQAFKELGKAGWFSPVSYTHLTLPTIA